VLEEARRGEWRAATARVIASRLEPKRDGLVGNKRDECGLVRASSRPKRVDQTPLQRARSRRHLRVHDRERIRGWTNLIGAFSYLDDIRVEGRPQSSAEPAVRARDRLDRRAGEQRRHSKGVAGRARQLCYRVGQQKAQIARTGNGSPARVRVSSCECARELECEERIPAARVVNASEKVRVSRRSVRVSRRRRRAPKLSGRSK